MKKILKFSFMVILATVFMVGCASNSMVQNLDDSHYFKNGTNMRKIARAIKTGASRKGWRTREVKRGLIVASINVRGKYFVAVNINYNRYGYKIRYRDSRNMKYNPADNTIHPKYNKWVKILEDNINYELSNIGFGNSFDKTPTAARTKRKRIYKKGHKLNLAGKTIYIKPLVTYSPRSRVATNIKTECTLPKAIADSIVNYSQSRGINIKFKKHIKRNDLELKVQIEEAISAGNAAIGHNKFVVISGFLAKGKTRYYSFDAARLSGGGYFGAYRSSCSVLGRIAKALGKDVAIWLSNPYDGAMLGDTGLIRK